MLSFSLSFLTVGPPSPTSHKAEVPLIETTTVLSSVDTKMWPLNPSVSGSQPNGYVWRVEFIQHNTKNHPQTHQKPTEFQSEPRSYHPFFSGSW